MSQPSFASWPSIEDLTPNGGLPGLHYCITPSDRVNDFRAEHGAKEVPEARGWTTHFALVSEKAEVSCRLMQTGKVIKGITPGTIRCKLWVDTEVAARTGFKIIEPIENTPAIAKANVIRDESNESKPGPKPRERSLPKIPEQEPASA